MGDRFSSEVLARLLPYPVATVAGGLPIDGVEGLDGGIGVAGPDPMLAAEIAKCRGYDIDKPRNLAKSVTVE